MTNKPFDPDFLGIISLKKGNFKKASIVKGGSSAIAEQVGLFIIYFILFFLFPKKINAQSFNSNSYQIQWGNFNMTGGRKTSDTFILTDSVGQNAPGKFTGDGFIVKAGFQYAYDQVSKFSFSIDNLDINLGALVPNIGTTQSNIITITTPTGHGYEIASVESYPLTNSDTNSTIPDTTCDNNDCDQTTSKVWVEDDTYGFGFNAIGINSSGVATDIGTSNYFTDSTYFRQFANITGNEPAQVFMSENQAVIDHSAKITYKVNIPIGQSSGSYQTNISFIAVPKY